MFTGSRGIGESLLSLAVIQDKTKRPSDICRRAFVKIELRTELPPKELRELLQRRAFPPQRG
jgi:hypothetical protein